MIERMPNEMIRPAHDFVMIEAIPPEEKSRGGIILPDISKGAGVQRAVVLAVGPGRIPDNGGEVIKPAFEPGDLVLYHTGAQGFDLSTVGSKKVYIISHTQLVAKLDRVHDESDKKEPTPDATF